MSFKLDYREEHLHDFVPSLYAGYEQCVGCGSFHSIAQLPPKEIYENNYWSHENGRSTLEEQRYNVTESESCGISKVDKILSYIPDRTALEIGCAPGELLKGLAEKGYVTYGVEPDKNYILPILEVAPFAKIIEGYFPEALRKVTELHFDFIVAMDIFEHVDDYDSFMREIYRLLKPGGTVILMSPIIYEDNQFRECDFAVPEQHCWIFTKEFLKNYLSQFFAGLKFERWKIGHEVIICTK